MIKSKTKVISILALIMCMTFIAFIGVNAGNTARATDTTETQVFRMVEIASVRTKGNVGIRFTAEINKAKYESIVGAGKTDELPIVIEINRAENPVAGDAETANLSVDASDFESQDIVQVKANLTFGDVEDAKKVNAYALQLKAICYAEFNGRIDADGYAVQDMRSVAHFNDLLANEDVEKLDEYYGESTEISGELNYLKGASDSVSVTLDGFTATSVYVNTIKVAAAISGNTVTIAKSDIANAWIESENNYVQIFDNANNVCYQKLTNEIIDGGYFSANDGDVDVEKLFGADATLVSATVLESDYSGTEELVTELIVDNNKITNLQVNTYALTNVMLELSTETESKVVEYVAVSKIIDEEADLTSVYGNTTEAVTTTGYFLVTEDIKYTGTVDLKPVITGLSVGSKFTGVFDGGNHTIEFGINQGGLFGNLIGTSTVVKNAAFIVKSVTSGTGIGQYVILAGYGNDVRVENVYATYDVEFTADLKRTGVASSTGLGLFMASTAGSKYAMADVIVDLSNVDITSSNGTYSYGVTVACVTSGYTYGYGVQRTHVIWDEEKLLYDTAALEIIYAEEDYEYESESGKNATYKDENGVSHMKLAGLHRYDDYSIFATSKSAVGPFKITDKNITWSDGRVIYEKPLGEILYDGEGDVPAVLPASLEGVTVTKITNTNGEVLFDGTTWSIEQNTTNDKVTISALVYGENDNYLGTANIVSVKKLITTASDLTSLYGNTTSKVETTGYFLVANDIAYDSSVKLTPTYSNRNGSKFTGVFDGNGYTVEYGLTNGGLFGLTYFATIKDVSLVVKSVGDSTLAAGKSPYAIIAGYDTKSNIQNVYATYDCELNVTTFGSSYRYEGNGLGLFSVTYSYSPLNTFTNVIVDLSKVNIDLTIKQNYGILAKPCIEGSTMFPQFSDCYVIWDDTTLLYNGAYVSNTSILHAYAANDTYTGSGATTTKQLAGVSRYDTLADMATKVSKVGNFKITADGISWAK